MTPKIKIPGQKSIPQRAGKPLKNKVLSSYFFLSPLNDLLGNKGSTAIILSFMVSAGVLGTIYFTQQKIGGFLSGMNQNMEEWEQHLVAQSAQTLSGYLVANNLILCREAGWAGKSSKCQWTTAPGTEDPSQFNLSNQEDSSEGLSFNGQYSIDGNMRTYKVTFSLADWEKVTAIGNLVGEIPDYVCRHSSNMNIIRDVTCPAYKDSTDPSHQACQDAGDDVQNSICEYISPVDADSHIVLIKVNVPFTDRVTDAQKTHTALSGLRRPLSLVAFQSITPGKRCSRSCNVGRVAGFVPDCRSDTMPAEDEEYTGVASNIVSIRNDGPGAIYKLSILKSSFNISDNMHTMEVTPDVIKASNEEMLLPGQILEFEYFYECPIVVRTETVYREGTEDAVSHRVRNQMVPFQTVSYGFHFDRHNPIGACYRSPAGRILSSTQQVDMVIPVNRGLLRSATCNNMAQTTCSDQGGASGVCQYTNIEPGRLFRGTPSIDTTHQQLIITKVTTITTAPIIVGDGGGHDGAGN